MSSGAGQEKESYCYLVLQDPAGSLSRAEQAATAVAEPPAGSHAAAWAVPG